MKWTEIKILDFIDFFAPSHRRWFEWSHDWSIWSRMKWRHSLSSKTNSSTDRPNLTCHFRQDWAYRSDLHNPQYWTTLRQCFNEMPKEESTNYFVLTIGNLWVGDLTSQALEILRLNDNQMKILKIWVTEIFFQQPSLLKKIMLNSFAGSFWSESPDY